MTSSPFRWLTRNESYHYVSTDGSYLADSPPSMVSTAPVINAASSLQRKAAASRNVLRTRPIRPSGISGIWDSKKSTGISAKASVMIRPGRITLERIPILGHFQRQFAAEAFQAGLAGRVGQVVEIARNGADAADVQHIAPCLGQVGQGGRDQLEGSVQVDGHHLAPGAECHLVDPQPAATAALLTRTSSRPKRLHRCRHDLSSVLRDIAWNGDTMPSRASISSARRCSSRLTRRPQMATAAPSAQVAGRWRRRCQCCRR